MSPGYIVGDTQVDNIWQAFDIAKEKNSHVEFNYHNDVFCNLKGLKIDNAFDYKSTYLQKLFEKKQNLFYSKNNVTENVMLVLSHTGPFAAIAFWIVAYH